MISVPDLLRLIVKLFIVLAVAYVIVIGVIWAAQTWLIFPTYLVPATGSPLPPGAERLEVATPDGNRLSGVRIPSARQTNGGKLLVIGFGGNAWHGDSVALYLHELFPAAEVIAFQFRGYTPSTGRPSAEALLGDAALIHDRVLAASGPARVIVVGFSIGGGVAAYLASERQLAGLIMVTPFDSLEAVASDQYPWAPVSLLLRHRMPSVDFVRNGTVPTAVIAAERDTIVPPRRTDGLRRAVPNLVFDRTIGGTGHNDIYHHPEFRKAMSEAFALLAEKNASAAVQ